MEAFADEALPKFAVAGHRVSPDMPEGFTNGEYRLDKQINAPREDGSCLGWQLDNGPEGLSWFQDDEHRVRVDGDDVFAVGRNGFAPFVSVGVASGYAYELQPQKNIAVDSRVVVMARRYLDEKDARAKMRLDEWAAEAKRDRARDAKKKKKRVAVERPRDGVRARQGEPRSEKKANGGVTRQELSRARVADEA
jgi:hypothetical protein